MGEACFGYLVSGREAPIDNITKMGATDQHARQSRKSISAACGDCHSHVGTFFKHFEFRYKSITGILGFSMIDMGRIYNMTANLREAASYQPLDAMQKRFEEVRGDDPHEVEDLRSHS